MRKPFGRKNEQSTNDEVLSLAGSLDRAPLSKETSDDLIACVQQALENTAIEIDMPPKYADDIPAEDLNAMRGAIRHGLIRAFGRAEARPYPSQNDIETLELEAPAGGGNRPRSGRA